MTKKPKKTKRSKPPRETSDRVSRIAGRVMREFGGWPARMKIAQLGGFWAPDIGEVRALAASCLAQDQKRGRRDGRVKR